MKTMSKLGLSVALLTLAAGCGSENASHNNHSAANEQNIADTGMIVDPEIPNAPAEANGTAAVEPEVGPAGTSEPALVKVAPSPPPAPKAAPKADAPKAAPKAAPKVAPKASPKVEPSPPPKAECLPEHRAAGHC